MGIDSLIGAGLRAGLAAAVLIVVGTGTASAQGAAGCTDVQPMLTQRKSIGERLSSATKGGKQLDAKFACASFNQLVSNGQTLIKWIDANKDWCQIPDTFADGIKVDHNRAIGIRSKACGVAAKQAQMEKQAREGGGAQGGLLGGGGLSGPTRLPQGAL